MTESAALFEHDDRALLRGLIAKDDEAWRVMLRKYGRAIRQRIGLVLTRYGGHASDALNEIVNGFHLGLLEGNLRKLRAFDFTRGTPLLGWLSMLAEKTTIDHLRALAPRSADSSTKCSRRSAIVRSVARDGSGCRARAVAAGGASERRGGDAANAAAARE